MKNYFKLLFLLVTVGLSFVCFSQDTFGRNKAKNRTKLDIISNIDEMKQGSSGSVHMFKQRMGHYAPAIEKWGIDSLSSLEIYVEPIFVDSTVLVNNENIQIHSFAQVFDFHSTSFLELNQRTMSSMGSGAYYVDSIHMAGEYRVNTSGLSGKTGDKLRFELVYGEVYQFPYFPQFTPFNFHLAYLAGSFYQQVDDIVLNSLRYKDSQYNGDTGRIDWHVRHIIEYELEVSDSGKTFYSLPTNFAVLMQGAEKVAVAVSFVPGYSWSSGDVYYSDSVGQVVLNSWSPAVVLPKNSTDSLGRFMEQIHFDPWSGAFSQLINTKLRYGMYSGNQSFLNGSYLSYDFGLVMDISIQGYGGGSISELIESGISINPNPMRESMNLINSKASINKVEYQLYDLKGVQLLNGILNFLEDNTQSVNVSNLPSGVYVLKITTESGEMYQQRVLKY